MQFREYSNEPSATRCLFVNFEGTLKQDRKQKELALRTASHKNQVLIFFRPRL